VKCTKDYRCEVDVPALQAEVTRLTGWTEGHDAELAQLLAAIADLREELVYQQTRSCCPFKNPKVEWRQAQQSQE
jgi:hypothetical protein